MRKRLIAMLAMILLMAGISSAQKKGNETQGLEGRVARLDKALIAKDTAALRLLLKGNLQYVHSNGWMETAQELRANLFNGKLSYKSIKQSHDPIITVVGKTGLVREEVMIDVLLDGKPLQLTLVVMQVWSNHSKFGWQLLGRQSTKVEKHG